MILENLGLEGPTDLLCESWRQQLALLGIDKVGTKVLLIQPKLNLTKEGNVCCTPMAGDSVTL